MAPKKSRRAKKGDPDSDDELSTQASTAASEGDKPAPKKASKKKVNKKNRKAGDWSDDEPDVLLTVDTNGEEAPAAKPTASFAALGTVEQSEDEKEEEDSRASPNKPSKAALGFAALQEEEPDSDAELVVEEEEPVALTKPSAKRKGKKGKGRSQLDDFEQSLKVARIESVQPHPNADRLKVCSVNTGSQTFKVVTNAPNAAEGKLVIFAGVGCVLPSTSTRVEQATLRGVESFGMLCSAFDIGWASEPDGLLVDLPAEGPLQEGDDCPSEPIQANGGSAHEVETEEADEELAALASLPKPKQKKKKSKKDTGFADGDGEDVVDPIANGSANGAFSALGSGDENAAQPMETSSSMFGGKKKKKSKKDIGFADVAIEDEETPSAPVEDEEGPSHSQPAGAFSALETDGGDAPDPKEESSIFGGRKKKKSKQVVDADLLLAALEDDSTAGPAGDLGSQEPAVGLNKSKSEPPPEDKAVKGKKQKGKAAAIDEENLDALLAQFSTEKSAAEGAGDAAVDSKKKKKKKGKDKGTDDLDAALAELGISTEPAQAAVPSAEAAEVSAEFAAPPAQHADEAAEASGEAANVPADVSTSAAADAGEEDGKELTAAQKKKLKKKAKEKAKKAGGQDDDEAEEEPAAAVAKKGGKKQSAAVRALQEKLAAERAAQEAAQKAEEDRIRREEEEALRAEEEAKRKEEEKQRRKEERLKNRAELKRQGLLLTGKAKQEAQRLEAMREQILKNAGADLSELADASREKKKVVYGKKRQAFKKVESEQSAEAAQEAEAAQKEAEAAEQRRREEEQRRAEEAALAAEAEAAAAKAEEEAAAQEEESDELGWEDMDLDAVKLPGDKPEPEPTVEPQPTPAEEAKQTSTSKAAALPNGKAAVHQAQKTNGPARAAAAEESDEESEEESSEEEDTSEASSSGEETSDDESEDSDDAREERIRAAKAARESRTAAAKAAGKADDLRSPICCILGHVDTGKTKLLDNIRRTSVQEGEAGGITQQIGATYVPGEALRKRTEPVRKGREFDLKLPGLLIIDTPGHESFTNLRSRGSSLCDIAILVVDIMHGLEPQTIESINLLKQRKTPFIVALNKVDRMFEWEQHADSAVQESLNSQKPHVRAEFEEKMKRAVLNLNEQGLNVALYWKNPDPRKYVNIVPTSAISGEGIPDMLQLLVQLTQKMMAERLMFISELQCTVLEVKVIEGLGTTIDVVLVNGVLHEGDQIVLCGLQGPIVTTIRSLLTPHPLKELRVKGQYHHHKEIKAAQGIKIAAQNLESAVAGTQMLVVGKGDDIEDLKEEVMEDMQDIFSSVDRSGEGVCVQASTLGSLEALLEFLRSDAVKIPVSGINIGPIHKKDVMRANVMMEKGNKKYGCILAFDVSVTKEAREMAEELGVRIFTADIIYHLFDQFNAYLKQTKEEEQQAASGEAVFPCILKILPNCVFNAKDPIVLGVDVEEGIAKVGTPLCVPSRGGIMLGKIASLELNHKAVDTAKAGESVAVKIEAGNSDEATKFYGRHFDLKDPLVSKISRRSIDLLKIHFKDALSRDDWRLVVKLKKTFNIGEKGI